MPIALAISSGKGGVGKSTTAVNVEEAVVLADRVILIENGQIAMDCSIYSLPA